MLDIFSGEIYAESASGYVSFGKKFTSKIFGSVSEERKLWLSNMYLGYSVGVGEFHGEMGMAVGMPRTSNLQQEVYVSSNVSVHPPND